MTQADWASLFLSAAPFPFFPFQFFPIRQVFFFLPALQLGATHTPPFSFPTRGPLFSVERSLLVPLSLFPLIAVIFCCPTPFFSLFGAPLSHLPVRGTGFWAFLSPTSISAKTSLFLLPGMMPFGRAFGGPFSPMIGSQRFALLFFFFLISSGRDKNGTPFSPFSSPSPLRVFFFFSSSDVLFFFFRPSLFPPTINGQLCQVPFFSPARPQPPSLCFFLRMTVSGLPSFPVIPLAPHRSFSH